MTDFALTHRTLPAREGQAPHPGVILLHGLGSNELDLLALAREVDPRIFAVSARAPFTYPWGGYMWYDLEKEGPALGSPGIDQSVSLLRRFIDQVLEAYPIDPERLYLGGFSMGASMAGALALLEPRKVAGALMLSGWLPPDSVGAYRLAEAAGRPFFQAHGTLDPVVSITYGRMTRDFLRQTPVDLTYREYQMGHEVIPAELADISRWLHDRLHNHTPA